ncbi:hypothetical protein BpHYR1_000460 [Brachionus plicatilis]|uniref:Uncharacterized protein n=1 Tax=Brachionus plicatilis TaxID=10195 RepID=A0A3M7RMJ8_BRAPC|nr:hypothetical protein BpHYR1_000460 [Brachionus plicatilis]
MLFVVAFEHVFFFTIDLSNTASISCSLSPLTPFLSLSSMNNDKYSGTRSFKLTKCSKSALIRFLNNLSSLKDTRKK